MSATKKSKAMDNVVMGAVWYVAFMIAGAAVLLGIDAIGHFIAWTPYTEFPWKLLRIGVAGGFTVMTLVIVLSVF